MYTKEPIQGFKEMDKDKAVDLFVLNGDRKMSYLSLTNVSCVEKDSWCSAFTMDPWLENNSLILYNQTEGMDRCQICQKEMKEIV